MPNVLVITLIDDPSNFNNLEAPILPRLIQRAAVHKSRTVEDAMDYISNDWPNVILVQSAFILTDNLSNKSLLTALINRTRNGCTTIFMGLFTLVSSQSDFKVMETLFMDGFGLQWQPMGYEDAHTDLVIHDANMLRTTNLAPTVQAEACFLGEVPKEEIVYRARTPRSNGPIAIARVGSGKVGYIGDLELDGEADRIILAMCGLDRSEDAPGQAGN